jgi:hypothetical protein
MVGAAPSSSDYGRHVPVRRRLSSLGLALLANILILLGLFQLAPAIPGQQDDKSLTTFNLAPLADDKPASREPGHQAQTAKGAPRKPSMIKPLALPPLKPQPNPMPLASDEPAATVSTLSDPGESAGDALAGAGGDSSGAGNGARGAPLYKAEWVREPSHDELSFYVQGLAPHGGWAEIACRTAPRFRVKYCQPLGESPNGSGLARAIIAAAWQYHVRPPLVDGNPRIGAWVRIRIEVSVTKDGSDR